MFLTKKSYVKAVQFKNHNKCQKQPPEVFCKNRGVLCQSLFFNKVAGLPATLLKKSLWHRFFSCEFCEISKNTFFTEHLWATVSINPLLRHLFKSRNLHYEFSSNNKKRVDVFYLQAIRFKEKFSAMANQFWKFPFNYRKTK